MKKILCFGDSNTYGFNPENHERYDENTRWTGILKRRLKDKFEVIEGGCNNRNGFVESNEGAELTGYMVLPEYLALKPDIVLLAVGIHDLQRFYKPELDVIKNGLERLIRMTKDAGAIPVVITPPVLSDIILKGYFLIQFDEVSVQKSQHLPEIYNNVAHATKTHCINLNEYVSPSDIDGLHYSAESHKIISDKIYDFIVNVF